MPDTGEEFAGSFNARHTEQTTEVDRGMGRKNLRKHIVHVRLNDAELRGLEHCCRETGLTISETLRRFSNQVRSAVNGADALHTNPLLAHADSLKHITAKLEEIASHLAQGQNSPPNLLVEHILRLAELINLQALEIDTFYETTSRTANVSDGDDA